jgi:hypothetical protein
MQFEAFYRFAPALKESLHLSAEFGFFVDAVR